MRRAIIMEENTVKETAKKEVVYKPNREQRRKAEREQRRANKKLNKAKVESNKTKGKLLNIIEAVKEKAVKVKEETGIDKMYFCINADNIMDSLIIKYEGSEDLKKSLGVRTDITLDNGNIRKNNIVIYAEVSLDNVVNIEDGKGVYLDKDKNIQ
jgi:hypothetical protein